MTSAAADVSVHGVIFGNIDRSTSFVTPFQVLLAWHKHRWHKQREHFEVERLSYTVSYASYMRNCNVLWNVQIWELMGIIRAWSTAIVYRWIGGTSYDGHGVTHSKLHHNMYNIHIGLRIIESWNVHGHNGGTQAWELQMNCCTVMCLCPYLTIISIYSLGSLYYPLP